MANKLKLEEKEIVKYLIDGLNNSTLQSQERMQRFKSFNEIIFERMSNLNESDSELTFEKIATSNKMFGEIRKY